jgi:hypothetical protein
MARCTLEDLADAALLVRERAPYASLFPAGRDAGPNSTGPVVQNTLDFAVEPPASSSLGAFPVVKKRPRQIATKACAACKRAKTKCTEERPCTRCIRSNMSAECVGVATLESISSPDLCAKER